MTVSGIVVQTQTFDNNLSLSGSIEANEQVEIRSEISGIVEGIYFKEGSNVSKGQLLFKVNDVELRAQLAQAKTKEGLASENERRAKLLLQKEAISQEEYDVARADYKLAQSQVQLIQAQIAKTSVRAPFAGKIGLRSISPGTYITPSLLVAKLVNISKLKITFSIPEKYANQVKPNSNLTFTVAGSTEKYLAKVYAIEPEVEISTRTLQVRAITENKSGKLLPGTFANVELPLDIIKDAVVVPSEAIIPIQNGKKVFISNGGKAKEVMPMAVAGALFSLWLFDQTWNIFSQIGTIMLIGLVTKNGILIVEFANQLREQGKAKIDAILQASEERLQPILMTSLAIALGALPIALSIGAASKSRIGMGVVIVGGTIFSLVLTLFVIPALYLMWSKARKHYPEFDHIDEYEKESK